MHAPLVGQRRAASAGLAEAGQTPAGCPRQVGPARTIALLGGALAGSGPGTSPCIDGLSLVSGGVPSALLDQTVRTTMAPLSKEHGEANARSTNRPLCLQSQIGDDRYLVG
jgi:hypothetical protein